MPETPIGHPTTHVIPVEHFDLLAAGGARPETIDILSSGDRSRRMVLLRVLLDRVAAEPGACGPLPDANAIWQALVDVQKRSPEQFDYVFMRPQTGMWIAQTLRRLEEPSHGPVPFWVDVGYAFNVALAVAIRAMTDLRTVVPHRNGDVMIPALGMARLGTRGYGVAEAVVQAGNLRISDRRSSCEIRLPGEFDAPGWWHLRKLRCSVAGHDSTICFDDIDPYREIGETVPPDRLSDAQAQRWHHNTAGAAASGGRSFC